MKLLKSAFFNDIKKKNLKRKKKEAQANTHHNMKKTARTGNDF